MAQRISRPQSPKIANPDTGLLDQNWATQLNALFDAVAGPFPLRSYVKAQLPAAAKYANHMVYVSDEAGGAVPAFSDGTNWRRVTDRAIVS